MNDFSLRRLLNLPVLTGLLIAALLAWMFATGHVARSFAMLALGLLWLLITGLWWALRARGRRLPRLAALLLIIGVAVLVLKMTTRYDGSSDGTALPRLVWKWQKPAAPALGATVTALPASELAQLPAGLADMPRFMGPAGDGVVAAAGFAMDWSAHPPREVWRQPVGIGWAGFAVAGRRAVTQEQRGDDECVTCYDVVTGKLLWLHADKARFSEGMGGDGPRATPTIDAQAAQVFTLGATGILNCLNLETGAVKWRRDTLKDCDAGNLTWGKSTGPLLHGPHVIVNGGNRAPGLIAMRRDNGEIVWRGGDDDASYSSPVLMTLAGCEQIVSVNATSVSGHDTATGAVLWSFPWPGDYPKVAQPMLVGTDRVLVTSSYGMKSHLLEIKNGADGKLSCSEVWASSAPRTKFSSAAVIGGHAYALDEGTLACVDLASGERGWRAGRYGYGQHLVTDGHLLIQAEPGFVVLVRPDPAGLAEVARLAALDSGKTWNPPTLAGRWLLLRNDREAVCYELPAKP